MATRTFVIAAVDVGEEVELRCRLDEPTGDWQPDLVVNTAAGTVQPPPTCFALSDETQAELDAALAETWGIYR